MSHGESPALRARQLGWGGLLCLLGAACGDERPPFEPNGLEGAGFEPPSNPALGSCSPGSVQGCSITLSSHNGVLNCYHGQRVCIEGAWGDCGDGTLSSLPAPGEPLRGAPGLRFLAITGAEGCADNPCDPACLELQAADGEDTSTLSGGVGSFTWQTGSLISYPSGLVKMGLNEPCRSGSDCQFDTHCDYPVSTGCAHNKCSSGGALDASCDSCVADICALDPTCCTASPAVDPTCGHDPCMVGAALDSACDPCVTAICADNPDCCSGGWDASCRAAVAAVCGNSCECGPGEISYGGACYVKEEADRNWATARSTCQARGSGWDLVSVNDSAENDFIVSQVIDNSQTWIGLTDGNGIGTDGEWKWASGDPGGSWSEGAATSGVEIVPYASDWAYHAGAADPGASWMNPGFDDSGWPTGAAQLGFGEGDEATAFAKTGASYYFRREFNLAETVSDASLSVLFDDGFVAYLNGTEVLRRNVTDVSHAAYASASSGDDAVVTSAIPTSAFQVGENVLAVQVKNRNSGSSDISFDAALEVDLSGGSIYVNFGAGEPDSAACARYDSNRVGTWGDRSCTQQTDSVCEGPPSVMAGGGAAPATGSWTAINYGASWKYRANGTDPGAGWNGAAYDDAAWANGTGQLGYGDGDETTSFAAANPSYYFRKTLNVPSEISDATLSVLFDDGFIAYVNGVEVARRNVVDSGHSAYSNTASGDNEAVSLSIDESPFVVGDNLIAVVVKNSSSSSSDISFDLKLDVTLCGAGGCPPESTWSQACVDMVGSVCNAECDTAPSPASTGQCVPWYPGETDASCAGIDLTVGVPCDSNIPVCNRGTVEAPAGIRLVHFPANSQQYPNESPDVSHPGMEECTTTAAIPPGECVNVTGCTDLVGNREIMVNPPGATAVPECSRLDNWGLYSNGTCGEPTCDGGSSVATLQKKPVDIVFIIDNSSSMQGEIAQVQDRINEDFAQIIEASGIDYRVIMMSRYGDIDTSVGGSDYPICVKAPLGGHDCSDPINQGIAHNPPRFYHYSTDVASTDGLCRLIQGLTSSDELASSPRSPWTKVAPNGYRELLREEAFKAFVVITDDRVNCSYGGYTFNDSNSVAGGEAVASNFDSVLLALSPEHFGTVTDRNYVFHSIVAMSEFVPGDAPWPASEPIKTGQCSPGSVAPGTGYQALSVLTGGLRYPTCRNDDFNAIFKAVAQEVIEGASVSCSVALGSGEQADPSKTTVHFSPGDGSAPVTYARVADAAACADDAYYYENATTITLCPTTCAVVQADLAGSLGVEVGCVGGASYEPKVLTETYESECNEDTRVQWGFLTYEASTPGDSNVRFRMRTADTEADLAAAVWVDVATAQASTDTQTCAMWGPAPCPIDLYTVLGGAPAAHHRFAEVEVTLNPTSDEAEPSSVQGWQLNYSCPFSQ